MESETEALAASAATALVGLMVTDSWKHAKDRFSTLFARRNAPAAAADLEEARAELVALPRESQPELAGDLETEWRARFPDLAVTPTVHNTIRGGVRNSPVVQSGRIANVTMNGPHPRRD
jgi:hypothetical protein